MFKSFGKIIGVGAISLKQIQQDFFNAVVSGDLDQISKLVKEGADPNAIDHEGASALHIAAEKGDVEVGRYLINLSKIDINNHSCTRHGDSPLITAVMFNRVPYVSLLMHHGANPSIQNAFGKTALHFAVRNRNIIIVKALLAWKAPTNVVDVFGNTPLSLSMIEIPCYKIAEMLLIRGADPNFRAIKPNPLLIELALGCRSLERLRLIRLLLKYKANVNITNQISQQTALHVAALTGYLPLTKLLINLGASTHLRDRNGRTPYRVALDHKHQHVVAFYKERDHLMKEAMKQIKAEHELNPEKAANTAATQLRTVRFTDSSNNRSPQSEEDVYLHNL